MAPPYYPAQLGTVCARPVGPCEVRCHCHLCVLPSDCQRHLARDSRRLSIGWRCHWATWSVLQQCDPSLHPGRMRLDCFSAVSKSARSLHEDCFPGTRAL